MRKIFVILAVALLVSGIALAKDEKRLKPQAAAPIAQTLIATQQDKDALIANISNMRNQELRVAVLGQLLNEEIAKLRDVQTVFCSKYKLDLEKFRKGLYRYDEQQGKFVEAPAAQTAPEASAPAKP